MTITDPATGLTVTGRLEEDECGMLWLNQPNSRGRRMAKYLVSAVFTHGWPLVATTPKERALLEAHGLASGRVQ